MGSGYIQLPPQKRFESVIVQPPTMAVSAGTCSTALVESSGQRMLTRALLLNHDCPSVPCSTWITQISFMVGTRVVAGTLVATRAATQERTGGAIRRMAGIKVDRSAPASVFFSTDGCS